MEKGENETKEKISVYKELMDFVVKHFITSKYF